MDTQAIEDLLKELQTMSPMPEDNVLSAMDASAQRFIDRYIEITEVLSSLKPEEIEQELQRKIVRILLDSLSIDGTFEVVERIRNNIFKYPDEIFYDIVEDRIRHGRDGTRQWSVILLGCKGRITDLPLFLQMICDPCEDVQEWSLQVIEWFASEHNISDIIPDIQKLRNETQSHHVKNACERVLNAIYQYQTTKKMEPSEE